jgi:hypothetical protein
VSSVVKPCRTLTLTLTCQSRRSDWRWRPPSIPHTGIDLLATFQPSPFDFSQKTRDCRPGLQQLSPCYWCNSLPNFDPVRGTSINYCVLYFAVYGRHCTASGVLIYAWMSEYEQPQHRDHPLSCYLHPSRAAFDTCASFEVSAIVTRECSVFLHTCIPTTRVSTQSAG